MMIEISCQVRSRSCFTQFQDESTFNLTVAYSTKWALDLDVRSSLKCKTLKTFVNETYMNMYL